MGDKIIKIRKKIDAIDDRIVGLVRKRFTIARKIGRIKNRSNKPIVDILREQDVLSRISNRLESDDVDSKEIMNIITIIKIIMRETRKQEQL